MFEKMLVANRGEIACRVFATCRAMGIGTVAVYSDPDAQAPHVQQADVAVQLPGSTSAQTYLRGELIIDAARAAGAAEPRGAALAREPAQVGRFGDEGRLPELQRHAVDFEASFEEQGSSDGAVHAA